MRSPTVAKILPLIAVVALFGIAGATERPDVNSPPEIRTDLVREIAPGITVIPDPHVNYVPNIGIIEGKDAVLVVDTGLGPENGRRALAAAQSIAGERKVYLTTTHFHPEHSYGAAVFRDHAEIIMNGSQADELAEKGPSYLDLFRGFGPAVAEALENVELIAPTGTYEGEKVLDLGGRTVTLREMPGHTRGDQVIFVADAKVAFMGDLAEDAFFPIFPDADAKGDRWIQVLKDVEAWEPRIVVPGHGDVGDRQLLVTYREYLELVRDRVREQVAQGRSQQEITDDLTPALKARHPDWQNAVFIPYQIAVFYGEATGQPPRLPSLETELKQP